MHTNYYPYLKARKKALCTHTKKKTSNTQKKIAFLHVIFTHESIICTKLSETEQSKTSHKDTIKKETKHNRNI